MENKNKFFGFQSPKKHINILVSIFIFGVSLIFFYTEIPASPLSSDVLLYIDVGLKGVTDPLNICST